ncbi:hypothetical protein FEM48_Zijuj10G0016300 [Ziziphus jujuba var. spinosa]|uniref:Uncharacterized protein n=1 Tax=Ziziphus jujuba var. spinosa TaxID=714518 RepID=A0A978UKI9_ZIZJJ|nr:hypothetical protein FEM48_Zijuj10G0016300 [Ziziphus jujuba var. spinosa]
MIPKHFLLLSSSPNPNGKVVGEGEDSESAINGIGSLEDEETELSNLKPFSYVFDLRNLLVSSPKNEKSVTVATRFQRAFMQLLYDAQFEELSARDLMLTSALNSDYLLTLPTYIDWKKASESNAIIFRRGYATETQKGLLLAEKLDYLQSKLLRGIFFIISKPLGKLGRWLTEVILILCDCFLCFQSFQYDERTSDGPLGVDQLSDRDLPIWLAAQRAVFRYEEPAFQELIFLYSEEVDKGNTEIKSEVPSLQLKIYERIPIPELPVNISDTASQLWEKKKEKGQPSFSWRQCRSCKKKT